MLINEKHIYLVKCYGNGNVSYQYAIDKFHEKCSNTASREALRKFVNKFDLAGSVVAAEKQIQRTGCGYHFGFRFSERYSRFIFTKTIAKSKSFVEIL